MTLRDSVAQLYTPIYDMFMLQTFEEYSQVHPKVYTIKEDTTKDWKYDDISGFGMWDEVEEAEGGEYEDPVLGYPKTLTHLKYIKKFQASFESVDDDEYALMKKEGEAKNMGIGGRARVEYNCAVTMYNGFSVAGADGYYQWYDSHPKNRNETGVTYDNLLSGAFSHDNLEAAETQITNNFYNMDGIPIPITKKPVLLHPPALRGSVARVLADRAFERPGTTLRDINRFARGNSWAWEYEPVEWIWLNSANGGSDTAWYIIFPWLEYCVMIWRQRPHFVSWIDEDNEVYKFKGRMRCINGITNWRCGFGSTGL